VGYEKLANWGVATTDETEFVRMVLAGQPEPPKYFAEMKRINREGPRILGGLPRPTRLPPQAIDTLLGDGEVVVDTRSAADYAVGHVPGTLNIPLAGSFTTWAGWLLTYDRDVYLLVDDAACSQCVQTAVRDLAMIGLDRVGGWFDTSAVNQWAATSHEPLSVIPQITAQDLEQSLKHGAVTLVDVRNPGEWSAAHIDGATHIPLGRLTERLAEIPRDKPIVMQCAAGARSMIGASILKAHGIDRVINLTGGFGAWAGAGLPTV
jgi:hydroxyacylglutathione hydrolase